MKPVRLGVLGTGHLPPEQCSHKENPDVSAHSDTAANVYCGLETPYCLHNLGRERFLIRAPSETTSNSLVPIEDEKKKNQLGHVVICPCILIRLMIKGSENTHTQPKSERKKGKYFPNYLASVCDASLPSLNFNQVFKALISTVSYCKYET